MSWERTNNTRGCMLTLQQVRFSCVVKSFRRWYNRPFARERGYPKLQFGCSNHHGARVNLALSHLRSCSPHTRGRELKQERADYEMSSLLFAPPRGGVSLRSTFDLSGSVAYGSPPSKGRELKLHGGRNRYNGDVFAPTQGRELKTGCWHR